MNLVHGKHHVCMHNITTSQRPTVIRCTNKQDCLQI